MHTTRDALLDAATDAVLAGTAWDQVRMADVARAAGVSRQTLYYEFGTKDALAQAISLREALRYADAALAALDAARPDTPAAAVAVATDFTLTEAAGNPLLKAALTDDTSALLPFLTSRSQPLLAVMDERREAYLLAHWPGLDPQRVHLVSDVLNRLVLSHLVSPGGRPDQVAAELATIVAALLPTGDLP